MPREIGLKYLGKMPDCAKMVSERAKTMYRATPIAPNVNADGVVQWGNSPASAFFS